MRKGLWLVAVCVVIAIYGCGPKNDSSKSEASKERKSQVTLTAGRTVTVAGGKASLYFGGYPSGLMVVLSCGGENNSVGDEISENGTATACGVTIELADEGKTSFGNNSATFLLNW